MNRWLTDEPAELFVCHGGGDGGGGGSGGGVAGSYSDAVTTNETNPGLGLGYPSTDFSGVYGDSSGGISGGGLGGDLSGFDAYAAYNPLSEHGFFQTSPDSIQGFWSTPPSVDTFVPTVSTDPTAPNFSTSTLSGPFTGYEGMGLPSPSNFGFDANFGVNPGFETPSPSTAPSPGGSTSGGPSSDSPSFSPSGSNTGFTGGPEGPGPDVSTPAFAPGHNSTPGLDMQLANMGWEGFNAYGAVPGMTSFNSWRDPQGNIHPLANFIRGGWANQRLYTPEFLADSFTDAGTSPQDAYEQLAGRGYVPVPQYPGVQNLNTLGGLGPVFPGPFGLDSGVQRIPGVSTITLGPDGQLSDLGGVLPPLTPRQAALLGIK